MDLIDINIASPGMKNSNKIFIEYWRNRLCCKRDDCIFHLFVLSIPFLRVINIIYRAKFLHKQTNGSCFVMKKRIFFFCKIAQCESNKQSKHFIFAHNRIGKFTNIRERIAVGVCLRYACRILTPNSSQKKKKCYFIWNAGTCFSVPNNNFSEWIDSNGIDSIRIHMKYEAVQIKFCLLEMC